jgi:hypothetical protein
VCTDAETQGIVKRTDGVIVEIRIADAILQV